MTFGRLLIFYDFTRKGFQSPYVDKFSHGFSFSHHTWLNSRMDLVSRILQVSQKYSR